MITTHSKDLRYQVEFTNGTQRADADVLPIKGGRGSGFGPHELMEASLACCINMWIRMQADKMGIQTGPVSVTVTLHREHPQQATFECAITLDDKLTPEQRAALLEAADDCPVRRTFLKQLSFKRVELAP